MGKLGLILVCVMLASACAWHDIEPPVDSRSPEDVAWAARVEADRQNLCRMMNRDTERFERDCTRSGDPD